MNGVAASPTILAADAAIACFSSNLCSFQLDANRPPQLKAICCSSSPMSRLKSIVGYVILFGAVFFMLWVTPRLEIRNVLARRSAMGGILLIGLIGSIYLSTTPPEHPTDKDEIEAWAPSSQLGRTKFLFGYVLSGLKWFIPVLVIGFIHDYFRETSVLNNVGIYAAIGLAISFTFYLSGIRLWNVAEAAYRSRHV